MDTGIGKWVEGSAHFWGEHDNQGIEYIEMKVVSFRNNEKKIILDQRECLQHYWEVGLEEWGNIHTLEVVFRLKKMEFSW